MSDLIDLDAQKRKSFHGLKLWDRFTITGQDGTPYLIRLTIVGTPWFALMHHTFLRSDADRCLHDHPWPFVSLILSGGYYEEIPLVPHDDPRLTVQLWRRPGSLLFRRAEHRHRVILADGNGDPTGAPPSELGPVPSTSLVLRGPKVRTWGFWTRTGWQRWTDFIEAKNRGEDRC